MPVLCANIATGIGGDTTTIVDNSKENESCASHDLDHAKDEFDYNAVSIEVFGELVGEFPPSPYPRTPKI